MAELTLVALLLAIVSGTVHRVHASGHQRLLLQDDVPPSGTCYTVNTTGLVTGSPALDSNILYFAATGSPGKMYAYDTISAKSMWEVTCPAGSVASDPSPAAFVASTAFADSTAYMGCSNGVFYALNVELDGQVKWRYPPASDRKTKLGSVRGTPIIASGVVYLVADNSATNVYAFNASTGSLLWKSVQRLTGLAKNAGGLALQDGILYGGTDAGTVFAMNATSGATLWTYTAPNSAAIRTGGNMVVVEDLVIFGAGSSLTALNAGAGKAPAGGKLNWTISYSPNYIVSGVAYSEQTGPMDTFANATTRPRTGTLVVSLSATMPGKPAGIVAVAAATGASRLAAYTAWSTPANCPAIPSQAAVSSGVIYVPCHNSATQKGAVYSFDLTQSLQDKAWTVAWYSPAASGILSGLTLDPSGIVIFGTSGKQLQAVSAYQYFAPDGAPSCLAPSTPPPPKGAPCWTQEIPGMPRPAPVIINDTLFWPSDQGYLYAMDASSGQMQWSWQEEQPWQGALANIPGIPLYVPEKDLLIFPGPDWVMYGLKVTKSGATRKWRFPSAGNSTTGFYRASVKVDLKRNTVYGVTSLPVPSSHYVFALDLDTGAEVWPQPYMAAGSTSVGLAYDGQLLYGGDGNGIVYAINATDGSKVWEYDAKSADDPIKFISTGGSMQLAENTLFFCCGTRLVAVSAGAKGGSLLWQKKFVDGPQFGFSVSYSSLSFQAKDPLNPDSFTNSGTIFATSAGSRVAPAEEGTGGIIRAFVAASGQEVMKTFYTGPYCSDVLSSPVIKDDIMYVNCNNVTRTNPGVLFAIDLKASLAVDPTNVPVKVLWQYITPGGFSAYIYVDDYRNVYYGNNYHATFAIAGSRAQCRSTLFSRRPPPSKGVKSGRRLLDGGR